jgi:hypothetical protein
MNHAQKYLAQANRQIAELAVQLARQRVIVKHALDTGQHSEMAESLLNALEGSLRIFEKHRVLILGQRIAISAPPSRKTLHPSDNRHSASNAKNSDENQIAAIQRKAKTKARDQGKSDQLP